MAREALYLLIKMNEGMRRGMYRDTGLNITVGVGHLLRSADDAVKLPFCREDAALANQAEIRTDFERVQVGRLAALWLPYPAIDKLLADDVESTEDECILHFPQYPLWPVSAQDAIVDMAFNLGMHRLLTEFPIFIAAAQGQHWDICANECQRRCVGDERNRHTKKMFTEAMSIHA